MSDKKQTEQEVLEGMAKSLEEIDVLMKSYSGSMNKAEEDPAPGEQPGEQADGLEEQAAHAAEEAAPAEEAPSEAPAEEAPAEAAPAEEMPSEEEPDHEAEMAADIAELSDEELSMMLRLLIAEHEKRSAHEEQAPNAAAAPDHSDMDEMKQSLEMSMKEEFKKLEKSMNSQVETLKKSLEAANKELASMKKKAALPVQKAASTSTVKTVEKAPAEIQKLSKSETSDYLLGQMRNGNKSVKSDMVALVNAVKTDEELAYAQEQLKIAGIELPKK